MEYIFIINPKAGKRDESKNLEAKICEVFSKDEVLILKTEYEKHAIKLANEYANKYPNAIFVSCGGDGTLKEILEGIYKFPNVRLAIMPIGTGNDFIRYFKDYDKNSFLDLQRLKNGHEFQSDILTCDEHVCLNIASVGLDAMVVEHVSRFKRLPFVSGSFAYYLALIVSFFSSIKFSQSLILDNNQKIESKNYLFVVAANAKYYGGGFYPTPMANIQDGIMDIITIRSLSRLRILGLMNKYKQAKHLEYNFATHYTCKQIQILGDKPVVLNMDGETTRILNPTISIVKAGITLILPAKE